MPWWAWILIVWGIFFIMVLLWCAIAHNKPNYLTDEEVAAQTAALNEWKKKQEAKKARNRK